ncbi:MAG: hypothetical protein GWO02_20380, partial [Gammaproteobacteria bacterium]|nr:hypothetical protein [Gammaproteobacteria bacterium]
NAALEAGRSELCAWSAGCGCGEEPYSLALLWRFDVAERLPGISLGILGTDIDARLLERARESTYPGGCLKELPRDWLAAAFEKTDGAFRLKESYGRQVSFREHDIRDGPPNGPFDLILCRNLAFTYFDRNWQLEVADRLRDAMVESGALVLGRGETLPAQAAGFTAWSAEHGVHRRIAARGGGFFPGDDGFRGAS